MHRRVWTVVLCVVVSVVSWSSILHANLGSSIRRVFERQTAQPASSVPLPTAAPAMFGRSAWNVHADPWVPGNTGSLSTVSTTSDDCSADDDPSTRPSPLETYESTGQCVSDLVYEDIVCTPLEEGTGECHLELGISYGTTHGIYDLVRPVTIPETDLDTGVGVAGASSLGVSSEALGATGALGFVAVPAQRNSFELSIDYLNAVRFLVAESNKWPNDKFNNLGQWVARRQWHTVRQGSAARQNVINGNDGIRPADWIAAGTEVLGQADAFGMRWGNCAEQASTLAGLIYDNLDLYVRVCYQNGHAWTEVTRTPGGPATSVLALDPWGDDAGWGARGGSCTNWYKK